MRLFLSPQSSILSYPLMLPRLLWLVFGEEKSDPEGAICRAKRGSKRGAECKCRPSRYYSDPLPVRYRGASLRFPKPKREDEPAAEGRTSARTLHSDTPVRPWASS